MFFDAKTRFFAFDVVGCGMSWLESVILSLLRADTLPGVTLVGSSALFKIGVV